MNNPKKITMSYNVAIVIPTLNEERFIDKCLNTVKEQSYPFEGMDVMVVDGGSTDKTRYIVNSWHERFENVRLIDNPGRIQSVAFNIGVASSDAPYIIRLDAHVEYDGRYVELCLKHLREIEGVGNVGGVCNMKPQRSGLIPEASAILNCSRFGIGGATFRIGGEAGFVETVPFGAFPRYVINNIGGMREDLARGEDNEYNSRIKKAGYKIYFDPQIESTYYARDTVRGCVKQMYTNGISIGKLLYIDRASVSLRHLVPLAFVLSLIICAVGAFFWIPFQWLLITALGLYVLADFVATFMACKKNGIRFAFVLPWFFFCVHVAYGWGTLEGILRKK